MKNKRSQQKEYENLLSISLAVLITATALVTIYMKHWNVQLVASFDVLRQQHDNLQEQWGQLLLEKGALTSHSRIERIARQDLDMVFPEKRVLVRVARER